jgi:predicted PurR-regulated permease PerM
MLHGEIVMENASKKKVFSRKVVVALVVICVVLLAGLVGTLVFYISTVNSLNFQIAERDETVSLLNSQLTEKDDMISSLNSQITTFQNTLASRDSQINWLNSTILALYNYLYLNVSTLLVYTSVDQDANSSTTIWNYILQFAGYVTVYVQSSSNTTYVELSYSYHEVDYQNSVTVGTNGTAAFPVLPALVKINVGNTDTISPVTTSIMAIYYY